MEYATEGMKWLAIGGGSYLIAISGLASLKYLSEKVSSQKELDRITNEEIEKLGLAKQVTPKLHNYWIEESLKLDNGNYEICIGGVGARRATVRHELYHIYKGHPDFNGSQANRLLKALNYWFRQEPQAILYEIFNVKL